MKIFKKLKEKINKITQKKLEKKSRREAEKKPQIAIHEEEKIEETKFYTGPQVDKKYPFFAQELPRDYGRDKIVLQTRDPRWIHAYWELTHNTLERLRQELEDAFNQARQALRIYDVSRIIFDGTNAHRYFDIEINDQANNWYIDTASPGRSWCVEFGLKLADGRFITIMRSNTVQTPLDGPSWITDEEWMVPEDMFARLYGMGVGLGMSSPVGKGWQEKVKKMIFRLKGSGAISSIASPLKKIPSQ